MSPSRARHTRNTIAPWRSTRAAKACWLWCCKYSFSKSPSAGNVLVELTAASVMHTILSTPVAEALQKSHEILCPAARLGSSLRRCPRYRLSRNWGIFHTFFPLTPASFRFGSVRIVLTHLLDHHFKICRWFARPACRDIQQVYR